jgi:hypothetical protein
MASSSARNGASSHPCPANDPPMNPSPVRKRILEESIAANREEQRESKRTSTWTKRPKYERFQSTLDSKNGLQPLPFSKTRKVLPPAFSLWDNPDGSFNDKKRPSSTGLGGAFQDVKTVDPLMLEMDHMIENSPNSLGAQDDPMMRELEEIVEASRPKPIKCQFNRQPALIKIPKYDSRYPRLLLQPDLRPISQEQLASEVIGKRPGS